MKRRLPMAVAISVGLIVLADRLISNVYINGLGYFFLDTAVIVAAFALLLGFVNVISVHMKKVRTRQPGWPYSIILVLFSFFVVVLGSAGPSTPQFRAVFNMVQYPIQTAIASLLIFFVASAAFRALRIRSIESALFVVVIIIVLLGQISLADELTAAKDWIMTVPGLAGARGLLLGIAIGTAVTGLRVLMGIDRPYSQ
jgi:hypothetical protein